MTPKELAVIAVKALDEKKGKEISAIEVTEQTTLADYFVIASGSSTDFHNGIVRIIWIFRNQKNLQFS